MACLAPLEMATLAAFFSHSWWNESWKSGEKIMFGVAGRKVVLIGYMPLLKDSITVSNPAVLQPDMQTLGLTCLKNK